MGEVILRVIGMLVIIGLYFLPSLVAHNRGHKNLAPIMLVNMFLGWSIVMWFVCLVWAMTCNTNKRNK